jgi:hypothetical protein
VTIGAAEAIFTATSTMIRGTATSALSALARGNLLDGRTTTSRRHPDVLPASFPDLRTFAMPHLGAARDYYRARSRSVLALSRCVTLG